MITSASFVSVSLFCGKIAKKDKQSIFNGKIFVYYGQTAYISAIRTCQAFLQCSNRRVVFLYV